MGKVWKLPPLPPKPPVAPPVKTENVETNDGADILIGFLQILPQLATAGALEGMLEVGQKVMQDSKDNYCPFRLGNLRESGQVYIDDEAGPASQVVLSYGGKGAIMSESGTDPADYALIQHENLTYHHDIGQAKYLERPMMVWAQRVIDVAGQSVAMFVEKHSTGWASGVWKQVTTIREQPAGQVISGYTSSSGRTVKPYYRRKRKS